MNSNERVGLLNLSNPNTVLPLRITSLLNGRTWSLAILRYGEPRPKPGSRLATDEFLRGGSDD